MRRLLAVLCAALLLPTLAVAAETRPSVGGTLTVPVAYVPHVLSVLDSYGPYEELILQQIMGPGLLRYSPELKVEPALVRQMPRVSEDGRTYSFWLRSGVTWHDGREMTAQDVAFTIALYMNPEYHGPKKALVTNIAEVEVVDRYVLRVTLLQPDLSVLDAGIFFEPPLPKHIYERVAASNQWWREGVPIVGAGPFTFGELRPFDTVRLDRNPDYWEAKVNPAVGPWVEHLIFRNLDERSALQAFGQGDVSVIPEVPQDMMHWYHSSQNDRYEVYLWDRFGYGWLHLQTERFPTNIKKVRQALAYGLDRKSVIDLRWDGFGKEPASILVPDHPYANPNAASYGYDPDRAHALLREAGFERGTDGIYRQGDRELEITVVATDFTQLILEPLVKSWRRLGVRVNVQYVDFNRLVSEYMYEGQFHALFSGLNNTLDPGAVLRQFHSSEMALDEFGRVHGSNRTRYQNSRVDSLLDQAATAASPTARRNLLRQAEAQIMEDVPVIAVYQNSYMGLVSTEFRGVVVVPGHGFGFFERWYQVK